MLIVRCRYNMNEPMVCRVDAHAHVSMIMLRHTVRNTLVYACTNDRMVAHLLGLCASESLYV